MSSIKGNNTTLSPMEGRNNRPQLFSGRAANKSAHPDNRSKTPALMMYLRYRNNASLDMIHRNF